QAAPHDADGTATHMGRYHAEGLVRLDHLTGPTTAEFSSAVPVVFTAADGDELLFDYAGTVELIPLAGGLFVTGWVAEFTPAAGSQPRAVRARRRRRFRQARRHGPLCAGHHGHRRRVGGRRVPGVPPGEVILRPGRRSAVPRKHVARPPADPPPPTRAADRSR